ncbi:cupin -type protein [Rutstroemia sp. NJR-2017a BVV2]|nr:cupin -type protein [Rutstroemia sp. NJR-2017a BVV2]
MSGVSNWIKAQRKAELMELADSIGLRYYDGVKKTELEVALEDYLVENASRLGTDTRLQPYYHRRSAGSPVKKEPSSILSDIDSKRSLRRRTKLMEEIFRSDDSESENVLTRAGTALTRTPRAGALALAQSVPLPPSPAVVADVIDRRTALLRSKADKFYKELGVSEKIENTRESVSNIAALEFLLVLSEIAQLQPKLLKNVSAFTIPALSFFHTPEYPVKIPDLFALLTSQFWGPFTLWFCTSLLVPSLAAYFFNLTRMPTTRSHTRYSVDPLTFNIVKGLLTFVVYGQNATLGGLVDLENVRTINSAFYGGYQSVLVGAGVSILFTMYDAVLKK